MNKEEHGVKFLKERGHKCALSELNKGCRIDSWPTLSEKCIKKLHVCKSKEHNSEIWSKVAFK